MDRENLRTSLHVAGIRMKGYTRMLIGAIGFATIVFGAWSAYQTYEGVTSNALVDGSEYLPQLVAGDLLIILVGAAVVLLASR